MIELLVVIVIIAVLAVLGFTGMARVRVAAAKTTTSSEMRQIHVGMALWMADNSATDAARPDVPHRHRPAKP